MQKCFTTIVLQRDKTILVKQPMTLVMTYDRETIVVNDGDDVVEGEAGRQMAHVFPVLKHTTHCSIAVHPLRHQITAESSAVSRLHLDNEH